MTKKYAKVEGHPNLLRDLSTNAIVNTDKIGFDNYTLAKRKRQDEQKRIDNIEESVSELKSSLEDIKQLLRKIVNEPQ